MMTLYHNHRSIAIHTYTVYIYTFIRTFLTITSTLVPYDCRPFHTYTHTHTHKHYKSHACRHAHISLYTSFIIIIFVQNRGANVPYTLPSHLAAINPSIPPPSAIQCDNSKNVNVIIVQLLLFSSYTTHINSQIYSHSSSFAY